MTQKSITTYDGSLWDSHVHIFPDRLMRSVFRFFRQTYGWLLPFQPEPDSLMRILKRQGVEQAFVLAYVHKPDLALTVNRWLHKLVLQHQWLVPFGAIHPLDRNLDLVLKEALDVFKFPGLKLHCLVQQLRPDDHRLFPIYEALIERNRSIIIHASSFPSPASDRLGPSYIDRLMQRYPRLKIIVPHLGLPDLEAYQGLLAQYPGLYLDTAFVFQNESYVPPLKEIEKIITSFPDRIIYGSDFPFILEPPSLGIERIWQLKLPAHIYQRLFYQNAQVFLDNVEYR